VCVTSYFLTVSGILDAVANITFRENLRQRQKAVAQKFTQKVRQLYPNLKWEWYATQEASLDHVMFDFWAAQNDTQHFTEGWADYLSKIVVDFESIVPGRKFLWSPSKYVAELQLFLLCFSVRQCARLLC
jgi:hypothetical protein